VPDSIYIVGSGTLKREQNTIALRGKALPTPRYFPIENTSDIFIFGEVSMNSRLLKFLMDKGICVHLFSKYDRYLGSFLPVKPKVSAQAYIKQFEHFYSYGKRIAIAKSMQVASVKSMRNFLRRHLKSKVVSEEDITKINGYIEAMEGETSIEGLRSYEGLARKLYFSKIAMLLEDYRFDGRVSYPPGDPINAMLSYGYAVLYGTVLTAIYQSHLDARISFVHEPTFKSYALQLDIADIFKTAVIDSLVISLTRKKQVKDSWFYAESGGTYLSPDGKREFLSHLYKKLSGTPKYKSLIKKEVLSLQKHVLGESTYKAFVWKG